MARNSSPTTGDTTPDTTSLITPDTTSLIVCPLTFEDSEAVDMDKMNSESMQMRANYIGICKGCHGAKVCKPCNKKFYCDFSMTRAPESENFDDQKKIERKLRPIYFCKRSQDVNSLCYNPVLKTTLPCTVCYRMNDEDPEGTWAFNPAYFEEMTKKLHTCPCCLADAGCNGYCRACGFDCFAEERLHVRAESMTSFSALLSGAMKRKERS